jgi:hypothetical protein
VNVWLVSAMLGLLPSAATALWVLHRRKVRQEVALLSTIRGAQSSERRRGLVTALHVEGSPFDTCQFQRLLGLEHLNELQIDQTAIRSQDLSFLIQLPYLRTLWFSDPVIGDDGVRQIARLNRLRCLGLRLPCMTDEGLRCLANLRHLRYLRIEGGAFSSSELQRLRAALPRCEVVSADNHDDREFLDEVFLELLAGLFGSLPDDLQQQVLRLPLEQFAQLGEDLEECQSLDDLRAWLDLHEVPSAE